ncbi:MAG: OPT/YSL family transporter [Pseudobacteriovorax sp.]|nr:OPT/YSL family transporter [Pseudobacteriovorax sp.]
MEQSHYREVTVAAVLLGIVQGIILNLAFVYAALKLGFSIGGSTVAAIMGYALLKGVLKKGTSIENNINQTIASGINTAGTGVVFTFPAVFMLSSHMNLDIDIIPYMIAAAAGSVLGVVFIIPLRKQMIDIDRLRFPSGVAVTTIIRSGSSGFSKAKLLGIGFIISAAWKLLLASHLLDIPGVLEHEEFNFGFSIIPDYLYPVLYLSLMNIAAGLLAGKGGIPFFMGGAAAWWIVSPSIVALDWVNAEQAQPVIYSSMLRPLGIGALIGGAIIGVIMTFPAIKAAITSVIQAGKNKVSSDELSGKVMGIGIGLALLLLGLAAYSSQSVSIGQTILISFVGVIWLALAALIVAQATGMTDISPMSGMALITVTIVMFILDKNVSVSMIIAVAVCVAIGQAADMMQDLKTGFMLGGSPAKQQMVQFGVTWLGGIVSVVAIYILWKAGPGGTGGFGEGTSLPAPQAGVLLGIVEGLSTGNIPIDKYVLGGIIGAILGFAPVSGIGVMVGLGMYLPFSITLAYGLGCLLQILFEKIKGKHFCAHKLVPFAAGLIIGEAIMGIGFAFYQILSSGGF